MRETVEIVRQWFAAYEPTAFVLVGLYIALCATALQLFRRVDASLREGETDGYADPARPRQLVENAPATGVLRADERTRRTPALRDRPSVHAVHELRPRDAGMGSRRLSFRGGDDSGYTGTRLVAAPERVTSRPPGAA